MLNRKTSRKKKKDEIEEKFEFNLEQFKEKVIKELSNLNKIPKKALENNRTKINTCLEYESLYRKYMQVGGL